MDHDNVGERLAGAVTTKEAAKCEAATIKTT